MGREPNPIRIAPPTPGSSLHAPLLSNTHQPPSAFPTTRCVASSSRHWHRSASRLDYVQATLPRRLECAICAAQRGLCLLHWYQRLDRLCHEGSVGKEHG